MMDERSENSTCNTLAYITLSGELSVILIKHSSCVICCRLHTLAYVASSGQLYSFGSGENGQLGNNKVVSVNSPVLVHKSWAVDATDGVNSPYQCFVQKIATGGDHCYVLTVKNVSYYTRTWNGVN